MMSIYRDILDSMSYFSWSKGRYSATGVMLNRCQLQVMCTVGRILSHWYPS